MGIMLIEASASSSPLITADMLTPITETITDNVGVILPALLPVLGLIVVIGLVPKLIKRFAS